MGKWTDAADELSGDLAAGASTEDVERKADEMLDRLLDEED